jgi:Na+-transporting NADH:ubiquinone oxidoreductase subunit A
VRTQWGADIEQLVAGSVAEGDVRRISGSVFGGRTAKDQTAYLGRFHNQVTLLQEGTQREFLRYLSVSSQRHSVLPIYLSSLFGTKKVKFTTNTNGSERAMVPVGQYERVMPLDILPVHLLRALLVGDTDTAQKLGALELDEEDLALCSYVCAGKYEYGPILRNNLTTIEREG